MSDSALHTLRVSWGPSADPAIVGMGEALDERALGQILRLARSHDHGALLLFGSAAPVLRNHAAFAVLALGCAHGHGHYPGLSSCRCGFCLRARSGSNPDVLELGPQDGAFKIEAARALKQALTQTTVSRKQRLVIIHDLDTLTEEAANALLKTFEEPPRDTLLIGCSPNLSNLLPTIRSRVLPVRVQLDWQAQWQMVEPDNPQSAELALTFGPPGLYDAALNVESVNLAHFLAQSSNPAHPYDALDTQKELRALASETADLPGALEGIALLWSRAGLRAAHGAQAIESPSHLPYNMGVPAVRDIRVLGAMCDSLAESAQMLRGNQNVGLVLEKWIVDTRLARRTADGTQP